MTDTYRQPILVTLDSFDPSGEHPYFFPMISVEMGDEQLLALDLQEAASLAGQLAACIEMARRLSHWHDRSNHLSQ